MNESSNDAQDMSKQVLSMIQKNNISGIGLELI